MSEPDVSALISVKQAIDLLDAVALSPRVERRKLADAQGYYLAETIVADRDYPPFDKSLMDGYAVRAVDIARMPADLKVVGEVAAGQWPDRHVGISESVAVMTGAPIPPGADGVVPVEDVVDTDAGIRVTRGHAPQRYISPRGSDVAAGHPVLTPGMLLEAPQLALAASVGAAEVSVYARPRVAVLGTGDELVPVDQTPGPAQIRNSNNTMLVALLRKLGCDVTDLGTAIDTPEAIREALQRGLAFDALFVTGGMSMGSYDYVPRTLIELGVDLKITKLRIKPGKPFVFGVAGGGKGSDEATERQSDEGLGHAHDSDGATKRRSDEGADSAVSSPSVASSLRRSAPSSPTYVFGLPGNPVSAFVCTVRFASRLLARLAGGKPRENWLSGILETGLPANGPREFYQPAARIVHPANRSAQNELAVIHPLNWKGSADLYTLAQANVLLVRSENEPSIAKGTLVRVLEI